VQDADLLLNRRQLTSRRTIPTPRSADMLAHAQQAAFDLAHDGLILDL
jgi:hypothetical protein